MKHKKIALFFLILFSFNQVLPMAKESSGVSLGFMIFLALFGTGIGLLSGEKIERLIDYLKIIIKKKLKNFLRFDFLNKVKLESHQIDYYKEKFKTACLNKDMKILKDLLENHYYIFEQWIENPKNMNELLPPPYYYTIQTPFFIACKEENENFLQSLNLSEEYSLSFFKWSEYAHQFLSLITKNKQEKAIELLLKYSNKTILYYKTDINWDDINNEIIKLILLYQFNNINLKQEWHFDDLNNNANLKKIILNSLQYLTERNQQLDLYLRAIINGDDEISNRLATLYNIKLSLNIYTLGEQDKPAITGYQNLLFIYVNMDDDKYHRRYINSWCFNDSKTARRNIEDIFRYSLENQEDKLIFISYFHKLCSHEKFINMVRVLLDLSGDFLTSQTLFNTVLDIYSPNIKIINLLLDNYRITIPETNNFKIKMYEKNENNYTFFYSLYTKYFNKKQIEKLNEINYVKEKIKHKEFINSELQSTVTTLFDDGIVNDRWYYDNVFNFDCFTSYIDFCINNGGSLTQKDKNKKLPLDYARERYEDSFGKIAFNSTQFYIKEKIYHTFLSKTPYIQEAKIGYLLFKNGLPLDCIKHILRYYSLINNDLYIAKAIENNKDSSDYYKKSWSEKTNIKEKIINKKTEELRKLGFI